MADHNFHPKYRPDIDGLRAVAVVSVVAFHAFPGRLRGGFIGVDVFFVISGYLISSILFRSFDRGEFGFAEFYAHRIRRIFPSLLMVLAATAAFSWTCLFPDEIETLSRHLVASAGFFENFVLFREAGYFNPASELKPLNHLWSLSVEEQFYLAYPLAMWGAWRCRFGLVPVLIVFLGLSFLLNVMEVSEAPVAAFFLPHTRLWELLSGGLLAYVTLYRKPALSEKSRNLLSTFGVFLLALSTLVLNRDDPFPGWLALLPVTGAALIIHAGVDAWLNRNILASRALVFVGLISYPLYLWHWPLLSFARIIYAETPPVTIRLVLVAASFPLAWTTYRLVERPLRFGQHAALKTWTLLGLMLAIGFYGLGMVQIQNVAGGPDMVAGATTDFNHRRFFEYLHAKFFECGPGELRESAVIVYNDVRRCAQSRDGDHRTVAIVGDSHAEHLFVGVAEALKDSENVVYYQYPCQPFYEQRDEPGCRAMTDAIDYIASDPMINSVVIAIHSGRFRGTEATEAESALAFERGLETTLLRLSGKSRVYLAIDVPGFSFDATGCVARRISFGLSKPERCSMPRAEYEESSRAYRKAVSDVASRFPSVKVLDLAKYLCDDAVCSMRKDGILMYRDATHLSIEGSRYIGREIAAAMAEQGPW